MDLLYFFIRANDVLTAGVGVTAFALALYLFFYNRQSQVARALIGLLGCVTMVYLMDLLLTNIYRASDANALLRLQWVGIAFTPAFYLKFVHSIHLFVGRDNAPPWLRSGVFVFSALLALLALVSDLVVYNGPLSVSVFHLRPGPLFYPFAFVYILAIFWGLLETLNARKECYTYTARRRMTYLSIGFIAPAMGVFPYLLLAGWPATVPQIFLWIFLIVGNVAVAVMLALLAYGVSFIGALMPDRVIKHRLIRFLLRGPFTAIAALIAFGGGLLLEPLLGLASHTLSLIACASMVILAQLGVELAKPLIDLALYREGRAEVAQVQELSQRLLTTADLRRFLENVLAATCELLRSEGGFLAILEDDKLYWGTWCGIKPSSEAAIDIPLEEITATQAQNKIIMWDGYWVIPIRDRVSDALLGLMGLHAPESTLPLAAYRETMLLQLTRQASAALEDRRLQQAVFDTFRPLLPELKDIQHRGGMLRYEGAAISGFSLGDSPDLSQWIHDALAHYWGGPRLTENPLLDLEVVKHAASEYNGNSVKGLRAVLSDAIEQLRPDGERKLTAPEWLLYNILELKFLRGQKVREVAMRLAVSESDFYRKQRVAIENLASIIAEMEKGSQHT